MLHSPLSLWSSGHSDFKYGGGSLRIECMHLSVAGYIERDISLPAGHILSLIIMSRMDVAFINNKAKGWEGIIAKCLCTSILVYIYFPY